MLSEMHLLWLARDFHVGGSFGLTANDFAVNIIEQEPSIIARPAEVIGSWAWRALGEILAGMEANSGELAKVQRFSTASKSGWVALAHLTLFSLQYSWSRADKKNLLVKKKKKKIN